MIRKSLTLVPVGPGANRPPSGEPAGAVVRRQGRSAGGVGAREEGTGRAAGAVEPVAVRGEALDVGPVGEQGRRAERIFEISAPPRPGPVTVTVSSPPESKAPPAGSCRAASAWAQAYVPRLACAFAEHDRMIAESLRLGRGGGEHLPGARDQAEGAGHLLDTLGQRRLPDRSDRGSRGRPRPSSGRPRSGQSRCPGPVADHVGNGEGQGRGGGRP